MKCTFFILFLFTASLSFAQKEEKKAIRVNPLHENMEMLENQVFRFPEFLEGKVVFKDTVAVEARLNYHRLFNQVLFISSAGDTLALSKPETIDYIVIGADTFYYFQKGFVEQVTHYPEHNLAMKKVLKYIGKEKKGAYGSYSSTTAVNSVSDLNVNEPMMTRFFKADEFSIYVFHYQYFVTDRFNNLFPASRKSFFNIFSKHEKKMKQFIKQNNTDFKKQGDVLKLLSYVQGL